MRINVAHAFAAVCVTGVTLVCAGCYKPAVGNSTAQAIPGVIEAVPAATALTSAAPAASAAATPAPTAAVSSTAVASGTSDPVLDKLNVAVAAAMRNPNPNGTPPVASRSPSRSPSRAVRTKVLAAPTAAGGVRGSTFDDIVFPLEKGQPFTEALLTDSIRDLFGRKIKIRGYIHPSCPFQTGVTNFVLVRDDQSCCFGPGALLYDCIVVDMVPGRTTNFTTKPIAVEGVFTLKEYKDLDGKHLAIYHIAGEAVE